MNKLIGNPMLPQFLYHGTSFSRFKKIRSTGLLPRGITGISSYTEDRLLSREDSVYLTDSYPLSYAQNSMSSEPEDLVILEVSTDGLSLDNFIADEDCLTAWMNSSPSRRDWLIEPALQLDLKNSDMRSLANTVCGSFTLQDMGTCCFLGNIWSTNITRALHVPFDTAVQLVLGGLDPSITLRSHLLLGDAYKAALNWLFNARGHRGILHNRFGTEQRTWESLNLRVETFLDTVNS